MALAYVPITLTNNESTATGSGFQQLLLNIDMRAYEPFLNDNLSNVLIVDYATISWTITGTTPSFGGVYIKVIWKK